MNTPPAKQTVDGVSLASEASGRCSVAATIIAPALRYSINTPLHDLAGLIGLLLDGELSADQRQLATLAQARADDLSLVLNNVLDNAACGSGAIALRPIAFHLQQELDSTINASQIAAAAKGLDFLFTLPTPIHRKIIGDPERLRQVIHNLLHLAIQYCESGRVVLALDLKLDTDDVCELSVRLNTSAADAGSIRLNTLFKQVARGEAMSQPQHAAAHLSFSICIQLLELMGGKIICEQDSDQNNCTHFSLRLPMAASMLPGVRVLFIDENADSRCAFTQRLAQHGMQADGVDGTASALAALDRAANGNLPYQIAILDHQMSGIDGETLGVALKSDPRHRDILLVLLSTLSRASDAQRFARSGFSAFLSKPVSAQALLNVLEPLAVSIALAKPAPFISLEITSPPPVSASCEQFGRYRILIVDDQQSSQLLAVRSLQHLGCQTEIASNLHAVSDAFAGSGLHHDLVWINCHMQVMDACQIAAMIRSAAKDSNPIPIIGWNPDAAPQWRDKFCTAGINAFICGQLRPLILRACLAQWLQSVDSLATDPVPQERDDTLDELDEIREMFGSDFAELGTLFLTDSPERIKAMRQAAAQGDAAKLGKIAHALSGSCASIGVSAVAGLCKQVEISCKAGMPAGILAQLAAIEGAYGAVDTRIRAMLV
ncbi:MAG: response regulator [Pseudomonadota bacterium]